MKITTTQWTLKKLLTLKSEINPKPQFQRGEVWKESRKQLLIDSILRGYDFPKIYLSQNKNTIHYTYDVADGQQRLKAIWSYFDDGFALANNAAPVSNLKIAGLFYSELPPLLQRRLKGFKASIALINNMPQPELRTLFARLQMGVVLTPPELRNAIASAIGAIIDTAAETHPFFVNSKITKTRFKRQDFLSHALALAYYNNSSDLKANILSKLYEEQALECDNGLVNTAYDVLDLLAKINITAKRSIKTKWGFVDLFWFLYCEHGKITAVDCDAFGEAYFEFEQNRAKNNKKPELLLGTSNAYLFKYIQSFNTSGGVTNRVKTRGDVVRDVFTPFLTY
jgi:hypothetical protein